MKKQYRDNNYAYLSARLSACESKGITPELLRKIADAKDEADARAIIRGFMQSEDDTPLEVLFTNCLTDAFAFADSLIAGTPDLFVKPYEVLYPLRFAYDAHNLKSAVKCDALGKPQKAAELFIECGTVPTDKVLDAVLSRDFSAFPPCMREAAPMAVEELAASHDPQCVDRRIDTAAFADMKRTADALGIPFLSSLVRVRADAVNIGIALRSIKHGVGKATMSGLLVGGGSLDRVFFENAYADSTDKLLAALSHTDYAAAAEEGTLDRVYTQKAAEAHRVAFGIERVIGYVADTEAGVRDLRIAYAYKKAGRTPEEIKTACHIR